MEGKAQYDKFRSSLQAAVKLEIALDQAFRREIPDTWRSEYQAYLRMRIRPAMALAIDREDTETLDLLEPFMEGIGLEELIETASRSHKQAALIWLLRRKERTTGFRGPDFSL